MTSWSSSSSDPTALAGWRSSAAEPAAPMSSAPSASLGQHRVPPSIGAACNAVPPRIAAHVPPNMTSRETRLGVGLPGREPRRADAGRGAACQHSMPRRHPPAGGHRSYHDL